MEDEENCALASKAKKGKEKDSLSNSSSSHCGKKFDKSKVRCFRCHEVGHFATNCHSLSWISHSSHAWFHP